MPRIREKNSTEIEKTKIIFQFFLMLVASVVAGIYFSKLFTTDAVGELSAKVTQHFGVRNPEGPRFDNFTAEFIRLSITDIICILVLFVFSFSFVNYIVSDVVLFFIGFRFGINSAIIILTSIDTIGVGNSLSFLLLRGICLPIFLIFSYRMALNSLQLRRFSPNNARMIINKRVISSMVVSTITTLGATLIFNGLYCLFLYIF